VEIIGGFLLCTITLLGFCWIMDYYDFPYRIPWTRIGIVIVSIIAVSMIWYVYKIEN